MSQQERAGYPHTASILAMVGGILILLGGMFFVAVSAVILPNLDYASLNVTLPHGVNSSIIPGVVGAIGAFGLIAGTIVLLSAMMMRMRPAQREMWGILALIFSILSFLGPGGFVVGAILGIVGGVMALRWRPQPQPSGPQ
jgi:hypothetical protein